VLVVVRNGDRFLMVQEAVKSPGTWFLPAGGVDPGESVVEAAIRETFEEAGIDVIPRTLLWMEDWTGIDDEGDWIGRWRFVVRADPRDRDQPPGPTADSLDAGWFTLEEIGRLPLRSPEVLAILTIVANGCPELPLERGYIRP
jgi:phosphatase NudJ